MRLSMGTSHTANVWRAQILNPGTEAHSSFGTSWQNDTDSWFKWFPSYAGMFHSWSQSVLLQLSRSHTSKDTDLLILHSSIHSFIGNFIHMYNVFYSYIPPTSSPAPPRPFFLQTSTISSKFFLNHQVHLELLAYPRFRAVHWSLGNLWEATTHEESGPSLLQQPPATQLEVRPHKSTISEFHAIKTSKLFASFSKALVHGHSWDFFPSGIWCYVLPFWDIDLSNFFHAVYDGDNKESST